MAKPTPVFYGNCDSEGRLSLDRPGDLKRHQKGYAGQRVELTLKARKSKRSIDQNSWLWGIAHPLLAEHLGYDEHEHERLHYDMLALRFGTVAVTPLLKGAAPRIVPAKTSSELNTAEFSDYMEWYVRTAASEFGCVIPLPNEAGGVGLQAA